MSENKRFKPKKASIKRIAIAFILVLAVAAGIYALLTKNDDQANKQEDVKVHTEENEQKKTSEKAAEKAPDSEKGSVTNETNNSDSDGTIEEGSTNKDDTQIKMPKNNTDAIIANAKKQVYTVYTDLQQGSGFLMNSKGDILTNAHVAKDAGYIVVKNEQGQEFQGQVIGISEKTDVALIRVPDLAGKDPLILDTNTATVGTKVVAIGSPKDQYGTTTEGIIQSIGAEFVDDYTYDHLYEITAKLNRGSSGGPLINAETGYVIGINSIILEDHPEIGYAIPLSAVINLVNEWAAKDVKIDFDDDSDFDNNHADEAYFDEELLKENMSSFYELVKQSIINGKHNYYEPYVVSGSEAMTTAKKLFANYTQNKTYKSLKYNVTGITIGDESSTANVETVVTYTDNKTKVTQTIKENLTFTIIIDEFGQYMISTIVVNSTADSGQAQPLNEAKPLEPDKPTVEEGTKTDKVETETNSGAENGKTEVEKTPDNTTEKVETNSAGTGDSNQEQNANVKNTEAE